MLAWNQELIAVYGLKVIAALLILGTGRGAAKMVRRVIETLRPSPGDRQGFSESTGYSSAKGAMARSRDPKSPVG
jgi:hypothetical protein